MTTLERPRTVGELKTSGYQVLPVREEMRKNLIAKMRAGEDLFPGIYGYEETVIPHIVNAILAGQDIIFLGERGQAKSRIIRSLTSLLDEEIPVLAGCEIPENPFHPITQAGRDVVAGKGDAAELEWISRDQRYGEKLATPDITIADLIGEVDPIKVAEGRYLSDELTIHYGLIPRTNRGVFCINELPDLAERIQVGLLNIMEERDVQIRGYRIRLPLDVFIVASANPEDYTNRGRIITPLKDRYGAQVRTHYPTKIEHEIGIMDAEHHPVPADFNVVVPAYMKEVIAEISRLARRSPDVNQRSGVSVRASIANYESMLANALRRAILTGEDVVVPRVSDLPYVIPAISGKVEFETVEEGREDQIIDKLIQGAVVAVFNRYFNLGELEQVVNRFKAGVAVEVGDMTPSAEYDSLARQVEGIFPAIEKLGATKSSAEEASAVEFLLEGLHLNKRLNKDKVGGKTQYRG
ncbi:MAG: magnesium chelatase [Chloroflexi bacterium]|nr:magnesium chelatase [Dehalococcoidia bacterium]MCO5202501.1 magnesium chelatase [Chloroflexota bacterium]NJD65224.1 magnesium chelatase [Chloroflexota bacterium]PWB45414.1 MAG: magnesium chelatase [Dehalococcoidia bacterium]